MTSLVKKSWPAGVALAVCLVLVPLAHERSRSQRLSNLDLGQPGFPARYLVFDQTRRDRCFVVDRRDSTMRRKDRGQPGRKWDCRSFRTRSGETAWLLRSKRIGEGTVFLVPAADVSDWAYPFLYDFVRARHPELDLPWVSWVELYSDRIYQGLWLWVGLPFDKRKKDGGSGVLREVLTVRGDELTAVTTRFTDTRNLFVEAVASSTFPQLEPPPPPLAWLARRAPTADTTLVLSSGQPPRVSLLPLPVSLSELYAAVNGSPAPAFRDERHLDWSRGAWRDLAPSEPPFDEVERRRLASEFEQYASRLRAALRVQAAVDPHRERLLRTIGERQRAVADLRLDLGGVRGS